MRKKIILMMVCASLSLTTFSAEASEYVMDFEKTSAEAGFSVEDYGDYLAEQDGNHYLKVNQNVPELNFRISDGPMIVTEEENIEIGFSINLVRRTSKIRIVPNFVNDASELYSDVLCGMEVVNKNIRIIDTEEIITDLNIATNLATGAWHDIKYVIDAKAKSYEVYLNGEKIYEHELHNSPEGVGGLESLTVTGTGTGDMYIDNISMQTTQKPDEPIITPDPDEPELPDEDLKFSYDFEDETVGGLPSADRTAIKISGSGINASDIFSVVEGEDINGNTSKMLKLTQRHSTDFSDYYKISIPSGEDVKGDFVEFSYDVKYENETNNSGPVHGMLDSAVSSDGVRTDFTKWGSSTFGFAKYKSNWYIDLNGGAKIFSAPSGEWRHVRTVINAQKSTVTIYSDGEKVCEDIPMNKFNDKKKCEYGEYMLCGFEIKTSKDDAQKNDFDAYFDNFEIHSRQAVKYSTDCNAEDISVKGTEITFKANQAVNTLPSVVLYDGMGNIVDKSWYSADINADEVVVKLNDGYEWKRKSDYKIIIKDASNEHSIPMVEPYEFNFTTEPESYDVTYKVTCNGEEVTNLNDVSGQTIAVYAKNRNYDGADSQSFISFAVLMDSDGKMIAAHKISADNLAKGSDAEGTVEITLPQGSLDGYTLKLMTWDGLTNGNILYPSLKVKGTVISEQ